MRLVIVLLLSAGAILQSCQMVELNDKEICADEKKLALYVAKHAAWNEIIVCEAK